MTRLKPKAFTLIEVLASVAILSGIIVTVLLWSADGLATSMELERILKSTLLAEVEMEKIKSALREDFDGSEFGGWSNDLGDNYVAGLFCTGSRLKLVEVFVGYDYNKNGDLDDSTEIMAILSTQVAERSD
jgi:prepilin-type N-terminal cleavage/methylation domain-containing protein